MAVTTMNNCHYKCYKDAIVQRKLMALFLCMVYQVVKLWILIGALLHYLYIM